MLKGVHNADNPTEVIYLLITSAIVVCESLSLKMFTGQLTHLGEQLKIPESEHDAYQGALENDRAQLEEGELPRNIKSSDQKF